MRRRLCANKLRSFRGKIVKKTKLALKNAIFLRVDGHKYVPRVERVATSKSLSPLAAVSIPSFYCLI